MTIEKMKRAISLKESELKRERMREADLGKLWEESRNKINEHERDLINMKHALGVMIHYDI